MRHNMGTLDRLLRVVVVAPMLILLSFVVFGVGSVLGILALVIAGVMIVTSIVGFCPTYTLFGISTRHGLSVGGHGVAGLH
jgi:hypothetical protein